MNAVRTPFPVVANRAPAASEPSFPTAPIIDLDAESFEDVSFTADSSESGVNPRYFSDSRIFKSNGDFAPGGVRALRLKLQVLQLISDLFPGAETEREPEINMIGQGSFNVVIGVTLKGPESAHKSGSTIGCRLAKLFTREPLRKFALRLPLDNSGIERDVVTLQVISSHLSIPVPKIIKYDLETANAVGKRFTLQTRLAGEPLHALWAKLNRPQRLSAVQQITKVTEKIACCTSLAAGFISGRNIDCYSSVIHLDQFMVPTESEGSRRPQFPQPTTQPAPKQTPHEFLMDLCRRWLAYEATFGHDHHSRPLWQELMSLIDALAQGGWLGDRFHLVHGDLFARNILAAITSSTTVKITGVVDWDMACFAPKFMALRAPFWAWVGDERDEDGAPYEPFGMEGRMLKNAFRSAASREYINFGLSAESVVARKLFKVVSGGMMCQGNRDLAIQLLHQWRMLHPGANRQNFTIY
ncbi:phosphotransferase enzyme family [Pyrenophora seminiperda CCB06]|uniref:Phosphotransferase enzyme family n=1 Tax=Pyrenophora seminiperda CCB06 TaxID=1302712 RepID=A0A3M7LX61_9PLEO|nr:phosphotransferase enzyme family [Pyrenophora seminiperda CCB06]